MQESMEFLDRVSDSARPGILSRRNVLRIYANHVADERAGEEDLAQALELVSEAQSAGESNTRLRALWIAATFFRDFQEPRVLDAVWAQLEQECWADLSIEDKGEYALGRAFCLYHSGEKSRSMEVIVGIIGDLEANGITNSVYLALVVGLGAIQGDLGDYEGAMRIHERSLKLASRMGDERRSRVVAANLAVCHCRLGNPEAQLRWADRAVSVTDRTLGRHHFQQVQYLRAYAYAVLGRTTEALDALRLGEETAGPLAPVYRQQAWNLRTANVMALLGREREALCAARRAVDSAKGGLRSDSFAGLFARWLVRLAIAESRDLTDVRTQLANLVGRERLIDKVDQAEILNAKVWLDSRTGIVDARELREMWSRLESLPVGVTNELNRMGMLDLKEPAPELRRPPLPERLLGPV